MARLTTPNCDSRSSWQGEPGQHVSRQCHKGAVSANTVIRVQQTLRGCLTANQKDMVEKKTIVREKYVTGLVRWYCHRYTSDVVFSSSLTRWYSGSLCAYAFPASPRQMNGFSQGR